MAKRKTKIRDDYLVFVDTNKYLDAYRSDNELSISLLEKLLPILPQIITSSQVEMEFEKNRQKVIREALDQISTNFDKPRIPAFLSDQKGTTKILNEFNDCKKRVNDLKKKVTNILKNPRTHDPVFKISQKIFRGVSPYNLGRDKNIRHEIRELAQKRFQLGYPPRKNDDTSMGDAVNWEWIINCASSAKRNIIIVSRDRDYGEHIDGRSYLNDWLAKEFEERVPKGKKVVLFQRLSDALKALEITVTEEESEAENREILNAVSTIAGLGAILSSDCAHSASEILQNEFKKTKDLTCDFAKEMEEMLNSIDYSKTIDNFMNHNYGK